MKARLISIAATACAAVTFMVALAAPGAARAADCPPADQAYNATCGPQFELPAWGDGAGWTDPSKYTTIQLADLTGNGVDELIARNDDGIEIWYFDTSVGQWRPALDANDEPEVLTDFHSAPSSQAGPSWTQPAYYSTIQTAALDGPGTGADIIARFPDGLRVYHYTPPADTKNINGGTWKLISKNGPFSDKDGYTEPSMYLSIHAQPGNGNPAAQPGEVTAQSKTGPVTYFWNGSGWIPAGTQLRALPIQYSSAPPTYLNLKPATLATPDGVVPAVATWDNAGIAAYYKQHQGVNWHWQRVGAKFPQPLLTVQGCSILPTADNQCFSLSPSYYTTLRFANIDGKPGDELVARGTGGLQAWKLSADGTTWQPLATLGDLKARADELAGAPARWASIRTGDVLGNGRDQVLALEGSTLATWSYDPTANTWSKVKPSAPLKLGGDMWNKDASHYSTIQVGKVTPTGPDAVIARGPYGIRTWFYNLRPDSGWTSYLPQDPSSYPQSAALAAVTARAKANHAIPAGYASVRDVWTATNAPSDAVLTTLQQAIVSFARCAGGSSARYPVTSCMLPADATGFTAVEWTAAINEALHEIELVQDSNTFFATLEKVRADTFIQKRFDLDAIISRLGLQGGADIETTVHPSEIAAGTLHIIGAAVGVIPVFGHLLAAPLEIAGTLTGLLASDSPTLNSEFPASVVHLNEKFADMAGEIHDGLQVQSEEVRRSYGLLTLLAQLTTGNGPWLNIDWVGLESANEQGFAQWVYKQLLPTLYARYGIRDCKPYTYVGANLSKTCSLSDPGPETIVAPTCNPDSKCYVTLGPPPQDGGPFTDGFPCEKRYLHARQGCDFLQLHDVAAALASRLFDPLSPGCQYTPGTAKGKWTFGCNLGLSKEGVVGFDDGPANGWDFSNQCYNGTEALGTLIQCQVSGGATVGDGRLTLSGQMLLPAGFKVQSASLVPDRLLYEPAGPDGGSLEVVDRDSGRPLGAVRMVRHGRAGTLADPSGGVPARLQLSGPQDGVRRYDLTVSGVDVNVPNACRSLSAADALQTSPFLLTSTLVLSNGHETQTVSLPGMWHCVRDRAGEIGELRPATPVRVPQRPGLAVSLAGPRVLGPGASVTYSVRVHNRRREPRNPLISSLWQVTVHRALGPSPRAVRAGADPRIIGGVAQLRRGRSRTLRLRVHVPRSATGRECMRVTTTADGARPAAAQLCARIAQPRTAGLG